MASKSKVPAGPRTLAAKPDSKTAKPPAVAKSDKSSKVASSDAAGAKPSKRLAAKAAPAKATRAESTPSKPQHANAVAANQDQTE